MKNANQKIHELLNLFKSKNFIEAEILAKQSIEIYPNNAFLYNFLGLVLSELKRNDEAIKIYKQGIKIDKNYSMFYNNLGIIYQSKGDYNKARTFYDKASKLDKKSPEAQNNLGNLSRILNNDRKAIIFFKKAINIKPSFFPAYFNLGILYKNLGEFEKAKFYLRESIKLNPNLYTAHRNLSEIIKYTKDTEHLDLLLKIYNDNTINSINKKEIAFALGKAFEDMNIYDKAFKYYNEGNNLQRKTFNFSIKEEEREINLIKEKFSKEFINKNKNAGNRKNTPIFILGMPRSGTTMIEQIISSHPSVYGGDELNIMPNIIKKHLRNKENELEFRKIDIKNNKCLKAMSNQYINELKNLSNKKRVTDKLTLNFKWIGLIKLLLPNSKIIHCKRNPKDTTLSIFKNYFVNTDLKYAYNLTEISDYYNLYRNLMNHWKNILPGFIYEIEYEKVTKDTESEVKKLLENLNLNWNKKCLQFYKNKRTVKTASDTQIRKKIYKSSVDSWKNFQPYMNNFFHDLPD